MLADLEIHLLECAVLLPLTIILVYVSMRKQTDAQVREATDATAARPRFFEHLGSTCILPSHCSGPPRYAAAGKKPS